VSEFLALIDIGSNAVRCLLARIIPEVGFEVLFQERVQTRLGGGRSGLLPPAAVEQTVAFIRRFLRTVHKEYRPRVMTVATAAVREAANRSALLETLQRDEGVVVQVLSSAEEAHLGAFAAVRSLSFQNGVVIDLGGGSLQLTQVGAGEIISTASVPLGVVRTTQHFFLTDPPTRHEIMVLREEILRHVSPVLPPHRPEQDMVGLGGTIRTLAAIYLAAFDDPRPSRQGLRLQRSDISRIQEQLTGLPIRDRRCIPGLKAERADIILAGTVIVEEVMTLGNYETLTMYEGGVRHGLLLRETFGGKL